MVCFGTIESTYLRIFKPGHNVGYGFIHFSGDELYRLHSVPASQISL
jgi:hypothetical protein